MDFVVAPDKTRDGNMSESGTNVGKTEYETLTPRRRPEAKLEGATEVLRKDNEPREKDIVTNEGSHHWR